MKYTLLLISAYLLLGLNLIITFRFKCNFRLIFISIFTVFSAFIITISKTTYFIHEFQEIYIYIAGFVFVLAFTIFPFFIKRNKLFAVLLLVLSYSNILFNEHVFKFIDHLNSPYEIITLQDKTIHKFRFKKDKIVPIPNNLREAHLILDSIYNANFISDTVDAITYHHGLGTFLRNNWGLWKGETNLSNYMEKIGFQHPDDMSGFILDSYHKKKNLIRSGEYNDSLFYKNIINDIK